MKREKLFTLIAILLGFSVSILAAELILRVIHKEPFDRENYFSKFHRKSQANCITAFDTRLGWVTEKEVSGRENIYGTKVTSLSDGTRSNGLKVAHDRPRILAIGDSFTFGDEVSDEESWPSHLERLRPQFRVLNAGVCGYGIDQAFLRSKELVEKTKPEYLLFSFIPLGVSRTEIAAYGGSSSVAHKPYFVLRSGALELKNSDLEKAPEVGDSMDLFHRVFGYSHFFSALFVRAIPTYWKKPLSRKPSLTSGEQGTQISCALMKELAKLAQESKTKTLVMAQYGASPEQTELKLSSDVLRCATEAGLLTLDLWPLQKKYNEESPTEYSNLFGAGHMTAKGNEWVAQQINKKLWVE